MNVSRGDVVVVNLGNDSNCSVQNGIRPCVVVSNNRANQHSPVIQVAPITSRDKTKLPTHVIVGVEVGLKQTSVIMAEQSMLVSKSDIISKSGEVKADSLEKLNLALAIQFGLIDKFN